MADEEKQLYVKYRVSNKRKFVMRTAQQIQSLNQEVRRIKNERRGIYTNRGNRHPSISLADAKEGLARISITESKIHKQG